MRASRIASEGKNNGKRFVNRNSKTCVFDYATLYGVRTVATYSSTTVLSTE